MPVARDIAASYRGPGRVVSRLLGMGTREDRALAILMGACALVFIAQTPRLAREAHLTGQDLNPLLGGTLMAWIFIAPLLFYFLAWLLHLVARAFTGRGTAFTGRIVLFWAFLASTPLILLHGLVAGFIGVGTQLTAVGVAWLAVFSWFVVAGLRAGYGRSEATA